MSNEKSAQLADEIAEAVMDSPAVESAIAPEARDHFRSEIQIEAVRILRTHLRNPAPASVSGVGGWKVVPIKPTDQMMERIAFNLCNEFGPDFVVTNQRFAAAVIAEFIIAAPQPPQQHETSVSAAISAIGLFASECLRKTPGSTVPASELFVHYASWCERTGHPRASQTSFGHRLQSLGIEKQRGRIYQYVDVAMVDANSPDAAPQSSQQQELTAAARDVLAERQRQIAVEGWTPEHDDRHDPGELSGPALPTP